MKQREIIFKFSDGLYNEETGEVVFSPEFIGRLTRCKDCKHRPKRIGAGNGDGYNLEFPDHVCPCQCEDDGWYNWMPKDDWYCADGEREEK